MATETLPAWGIPNTSERGRNQKWPNTWATWLHNPYRPGGSQRLRTGDKIRSGPTSGPRSYIPLAAQEVRNASEQETKSVVPNKGARWLHNPCC